MLKIRYKHYLLDLGLTSTIIDQNFVHDIKTFLAIVKVIVMEY